MVVNILKNIMQLVGALGPSPTFMLAASVVVSSSLAAITSAWFLLAPANDKLQPCNKGFVNTWKAASYSAALASAVVMFSAGALGPIRFPTDRQLPVLLVTWGAVIFTFVLIYKRWSDQNPEFATDSIQTRQVAFPFLCRDARLALEVEGFDTDLAFAFVHLYGTDIVKPGDRKENGVKVGSEDVDWLQLRSLPGWDQSSWFDATYGTAQPPEHVQKRKDAVCRRVMREWAEKKVKIGKEKKHRPTKFSFHTTVELREYRTNPETPHV